MRYVQKEKKEEKDDGVRYAASDESLAKKYPAITEHLEVFRLDDGTPRWTSTITIFCEDGLYKVCLSDRDNKRVLFASAAGLFDALGELEEALESSKPGWRQAKNKR